MIYILLIFSSNVLFSQDSKLLDSLIIESGKKHHDTTMVNIMNSTAWEYRNSDMDKVKLFSDSALVLAKKIDYKKGQVKSYFNIGNMHYIKGDFSKTLENYLTALEILEQENNQNGIASALMGIGNIHAIQQNYDKAIEYQEKALKIRVALNDSLGMAASYNNIGSIYMDKKLYRTALEYHFKSLAIKEKLDYWKGMSSSYGNIGIAYKELGELSKAISYQNKALKIRKELNNIKGMVMSYTDIGNIYNDLRDYNKALENHLKALEYSREVSFGEGEMSALLALSITSENLGKQAKALKWYKEYSNKKDSLFTISKSKEIAKMESIYTTEKQKQQILMLEKDNTIQQLQIKAQDEQLATERLKNVAVFSVLALVICLAFFLFYTSRKRKKANEIIAHQKEIVEEKNQEIMDSISYAKRIQSAILPPDKLVKEYLENSFILYKPKDIVAGDFYWLEHKNNKILFAAADCTGHGVPGAMVSVVCNNGLNRSVREHDLTIPGKILDKTREIIVEEFEKSEEEVNDGMDIALCTLEGNKLQYAGANNPLWIIRNGEIIETKANKQPIGKFDNPEPYTTHEFDLESGDSLYVFSDGFVDQFGGEKGKKFKARAFRDLLLSIQNKSMEEQKKIIDDTFEKWKGDLEQIDDVCVIGVRV